MKIKKPNSVKGKQLIDILSLEKDGVKLNRKNRLAKRKLTRQLVAA